MRLASTFKQPYDGLLRQSLDEHFWFRKLKSKQVTELSIERSVHYHSHRPADNCEIQPYLYVVNNKMVPIIVVTQWKPAQFSWAKELIGQWACHSFFQFINSHCVAGTNYPNYEREQLRKFFDQKDKEVILDAPVGELYIDDYYDEVKRQRVDKVFADLNVELPPCFFAVMQPYEVYHEVMYWFNNRANPEKPMVQISNNDRLQQHGFDKMSFRKRK